MGVVKFSQAELVPAAIDYLSRLVEDLKAGKILIHEMGLNVTPVGPTLQSIHLELPERAKPEMQVDAFNIRVVRML